MTTRSIGVRELRQQASKYLREVQRGETIEVTDHGQPAALLTPIPDGSRLEGLAASGRLTPAVGDLLDLGKPLKPAPQVRLPSEALAKARADER